MFSDLLSRTQSEIKSMRKLCQISKKKTFKETDKIIKKWALNIESASNFLDLGTSVYDTWYQLKLQ